ncbi:MAG: hypothetical protein JWP29_951 [Rhodoferax sp.]|nr:hypothetical protein [Rhodoferax sp.]
MALWLFCAAYVLPGFIGRAPWKTADMTAFGYMRELANGTADWLAPRLMELSPDIDALLPYWLGALLLKLAPAWMAPDFAVRIGFGVLLALTLVATWYAVYFLARSPRAQPVAFAFGGEAEPADYARAMADGGLLALMACLGMAQLSHETTPALAQLSFTALAFYGMAAMPYRTFGPALGTVLGLTGLALSGAPSMAVLLGLGGALVCFLDRHEEHGLTGSEVALHSPVRSLSWTGLVLASTALAAGLAEHLALWRWRIELPHATWHDWRSIGQLLLWFTWPVWPLALWTLWRWRRQLTSGNFGRHLALPLWFFAVALGTTLTTQSADRSLLLALPALATLAAFALPTLSRTVAALIDWFTLLFFTACALGIWVIWIATQTGFPRQPAANVAKLAPGFEPSFSALAFGVALVASLGWAWLVKWRAGRHRAAIWKSLVLPAGGTALCWLLLMTLWLPLLEWGRSYVPLVRAVEATIRADNQTGCVEVYGLNRGQIAALKYHGNMQLEWARKQASCPWMIVDTEDQHTLPTDVDMSQWSLRLSLRRRTTTNDDVLLYKRIEP